MKKPTSKRARKRSLRSKPVPPTAKARRKNLKPTVKSRVTRRWLSDAVGAVTI